jgi:hypothetical protein
MGALWVNWNVLAIQSIVHTHTHTHTHTIYLCLLTPCRRHAPTRLPSQPETLRPRFQGFCYSRLFLALRLLSDTELALIAVLE